MQENTRLIPRFEELLEQLSLIKSSPDGYLLDAFVLRTKMLIKESFGANSDYLSDFKRILFHNSLDKTTSAMAWTWNNGCIEASNLITVMIEHLSLISERSLQNSLYENNRAPLSNKIFLVHGHDEAMKQSVARTLEKLGLEPIILHEKPSTGRTIIEKFSDYADVSFAVVLLSPDDLGYSKVHNSKKAMFRARQNVILELGYFLGKLGRAHVTALHASEKNFEIPSDYSGVLFIPFDASGQWKFDLVKELQACGFDVDANKLIR